MWLQCTRLESGVCEGSGGGSNGCQTAVCIQSHRGRSPPSWEVDIRVHRFSTSKSQTRLPNSVDVPPMSSKSSEQGDSML